MKIQNKSNISSLFYYILHYKRHLFMSAVNGIAWCYWSMEKIRGWIPKLAEKKKKYSKSIFQKDVLETSVLCLSTFNIPGFLPAFLWLSIRNSRLSFKGHIMWKYTSLNPIITLNKISCSYTGLYWGPLSSWGQNRSAFPISHSM